MPLLAQVGGHDDEDAPLALEAGVAGHDELHGAPEHGAESALDRDLAAFGLVLEDPEPAPSTDFEVWEENWQSFVLFTQLQTQWVVDGMSARNPKLTPWYPPEVKPVREGVYERDMPGLEGEYSYFAHGAWYGWSATIEIANNNYHHGFWLWN